MARKKDTPCAAGCGTLVWRPSRTSSAAPICRECRYPSGEHGTRLMYRERNCRCEECRAWNRTQMAAYIGVVRDRDGLSPTQKIRPRRNPVRNCVMCGEPILGRATSDQPMHNACRPEKFWSNAIQISDRDRLAIYERDGWTCQLCGDPVDPTLDPVRDAMAATLDHIAPRSLTLFPDDSPANLRLAHRACNSRRCNRVA